MSRRIRRLLDRLRDWWDGEPGRHGRGYAYPAPVIARPTAAEHAEAEAELADKLADALLRAKYPRLFASDEDYWRQRWIDWYAWTAQQTARRYSYRDAWGLEPETLLDYAPTAGLAAA